MMNAVRIIGGEWRSRRIYFPDVPGLRPTQDRIRETLFNWLSPIISGATCLDLFAGSGALGFEALSRGAQFCCFVDDHPLALSGLRLNAEKLKIKPDRYTILRGNARRLSVLPRSPYDIIFLDPPFHQHLLAMSINWLVKSESLASNALIYVEMEKDLDLELPAGWKILRRKTTAALIYQLLGMCTEITPN